MKINKNYKKRNKHIRLLALILLPVVIITLLLAFAYTQSYWPFHATKTETSQSENGTDNSPTEQEVKDSQDAKKNLINEHNNTPDTSDTDELSNVLVGVSFADTVGDHVEIRAFTPSVIEGDGTCTATLTRQGLSITVSSRAFIDSTSSICQPININLSEFHQSGNWSLTVSYKSSKSQGKSEIIEVEIP